MTNSVVDDKIHPVIRALLLGVVGSWVMMNVEDSKLWKVRLTLARNVRSDSLPFLSKGKGIFSEPTQVLKAEASHLPYIYVVAILTLALCNSPFHYPTLTSSLATAPKFTMICGAYFE